MPWKAPDDVLKTAGVSFGPGEGQYPHRITTEVMQVWLYASAPHEGFLASYQKQMVCHAALARASDGLLAKVMLVLLARLCYVT